MLNSFRIPSSSSKKVQVTILEGGDDDDDKQQTNTQPSNSSLIEELPSNPMIESSIPSTSSCSTSPPSAFHVVSTTFSKDTDAAMKQNFDKWNITPTCTMKKWRYEHDIDVTNSASVDSFLVDFFSSPSIQSSLEIFHGRRVQPVSSALSSHSNIASVVSNTLINTWNELTFLNKLYEENIVRYQQSTTQAEEDDPSNYTISKCFEDVSDSGVVVADQLREMLLMRDSDHYSLFSKQDRAQSLFQLLMHVCVGGALCQYEDSLLPYIDAVKLLYRDLVEIRTNTNTNQFHVVNCVRKVEKIIDSNHEEIELFPQKRHPHNLCLVSIEPFKQHITCYYFAYTSIF